MVCFSPEGLASTSCRPQPRKQDNCVLYCDVAFAAHSYTAAFPDHPVSDRLATALQYLAPKQAITALAGRWAAAHAGRWTTSTIRWFIARYRVDMSEAEQPDPAAYASFNAFFTRRLRPDARPLAQAAMVCPVDGCVSQLGAIEGDSIFQAKGHSYSTSALLAGDSELAAHFANGHFATLYLSPRDYHRIHMPCDGQLLRMIHVPGSLFSVNPTTARNVPGLFARNERVVCLFDTPLGQMALILVGATIVGSMSTVWHGRVNPPRTRQVRHWDYAPGQVALRQGAEMGQFQLGSTVIVLLQRSAVQWSAQWHAGRPVRLGEAMGEHEALNPRP